jgi:hypothetical protein
MEERLKVYVQTVGPGASGQCNQDVRRDKTLLKDVMERL